MAPFRWSSLLYDILLCKEVLARRPSSPFEWDNIAETLSELFSTPDKVIDVKGRGCRERIDRLSEKYNQDDKKALKKSGTEEEYTELQQLLQDISTYKRDMQELKDLKTKGRDRKKEKEKQDREKGVQMRAAALSGMANRKHESDDSGASNWDNDDGDGESGPTPAKKASKPRKRASRLSVVNMLEEKYDRKVSLKEQELKQRMLEFEFQKKKFEIEADERKERLNLELEKKRVFLSLLKDKL